MSDKTRIEWTDATWNPVTGCTKVSEGCDHCYAETIAHRFAGTKAYPNGFEVTLRPERLDQPAHRQSHLLEPPDPSRTKPRSPSRGCSPYPKETRS